MKALIRTIGLTTVMATSSVMAGPVNQANVNTFSSGSAAMASEVNQNFQALITAIDDNAQQIAALQDASVASVAGRTYELRVLGNIFRGDQVNNGSTLGSYAQQYTLTFDNTGGFTFSGSLSESEIDAVTGTVYGVESGTADSGSGSWSQSGNTVSTSIGEFVVTADGSVILSNGFTHEADGDYMRTETNIIVGTLKN